MLNKNKLLIKLEDFVPKFFLNLNQEKLLAIKYFNWLMENSDKIELILKSDSKYLMPIYNKDDWDNINIIKCLNLADQILNYNILAVDGSQIYPDRNIEISCFLINIGFVQINYCQDNSTVYLDSEPYLYQCADENLSQEIVNCKRSELEFKKGFDLGINFFNLNKGLKDFLFLSDGTLLFCYLDNSNSEIKNYFLSRYIELLELYYKNGIPIFGFISFPKSKDILNIIKSGLEAKIIPNLLDNKDNFSNNNDNKLNKLSNISDADLMWYFLKPFSRSSIFSSNSKILTYYPDHLKIKFCYINIESEIIRVEFPAWIADNIELLDNMLKIIIDQCIKGAGYPVVLSEAHEQAVVKNYEREFFLQQLCYISESNNNRLNISQKSVKKRFINI